MKAGYGFSPQKNAHLQLLVHVWILLWEGQGPVRPPRSTGRGLGSYGFSLSDEKQGVRQIKQIPRSHSQPGGKLELLSLTVSVTAQRLASSRPAQEVQSGPQEGASRAGTSPREEATETETPGPSLHLGGTRAVLSNTVTKILPNTEPCSLLMAKQKIIFTRHDRRWPATKISSIPSFSPERVLDNPGFPPASPARECEATKPLRQNAWASQNGRVSPGRASSVLPFGLHGESPPTLLTGAHDQGHDLNPTSAVAVTSGPRDTPTCGQHVKQAPLGTC